MFIVGYIMRPDVRECAQDTSDLMQIHEPQDVGPIPDMGGRSTPEVESGLLLMICMRFLLSMYESDISETSRECNQT